MLLAGLLFQPAARPAQAAPVTYYISNSGGNDSNPGTSELQPFKSIDKVNGLALQPGDQVLFKCGDVWRGTPLEITRSGASGSPITFSSYPAGCANQPLLDGTQLIGGWSVYSGSIYAADLNSGGNAGKFPNGINQLFRNGTRLTMGRWPNLNAGDGGYSTVDGQPANHRISDNQLPAVNWTGATIHLKVIRWSMINRNVTGRSGNTLTLNADALCPFTTNCTGWGYFINNHLSTLDQDGEWYYDKNAGRVYLYASSNPSAHTIEGSVVLRTDDRNWGGVVVGTDLDLQVAHVTVDNFHIRGWFRNGITWPTNLHPDENAYITLSNNRIVDVDDTGIDLFSWVWGAADGLDGWRGGNHITIRGNWIDGANSMGIHTPSRETLIEGNTIRNIGLIRNLNEAGMGCSITEGEGHCTEDGSGLRIYVDNPSRSGYGFTIQNNHFEEIGYHGIQIFGANITVQENVFYRTNVSKGDGGAVNTFGNENFSATKVHDVQILNNLILHTIGNTDGTHSSFRSLFAFGVYIDQFSRNVTTSGNVVAWSTVHGILYQNSTGSVTNNLLFDNVTGSMWANQVHFTSGSSATALTGNTLISKAATARSLSVKNKDQIVTINNNRYFHASKNDHIHVQDQSDDKTFAEWKAYSGKDAQSTNLVSGVVGSYILYYNAQDTPQPASLPVGWDFCDLSGAVVPSLTLQPRRAAVLYPCGPAPYTVNLPLIRK